MNIELCHVHVLSINHFGEASRVDCKNIEFKDFINNQHELFGYIINEATPERVYLVYIMDEVFVSENISSSIRFIESVLKIQQLNSDKSVSFAFSGSSIN